MAKIKIKQIRSGINRDVNQNRTLIALGLGSVNHEVTVEETPQIRGMLRKVHHLVRVTK